MGWKVEMEGKVVSVISYRSWKGVLDKPDILVKGIHLLSSTLYHYPCPSQSLLRADTPLTLRQPRLSTLALPQAQFPQHKQFPQNPSRVYYPHSIHLELVPLHIGSMVMMTRVESKTIESPV